MSDGVLLRRITCLRAARVPFGWKQAALWVNKNWSCLGRERREKMHYISSFLPPPFPLWHQIKRCLIWYSTRFLMSLLSPYHPGWVWFLLCILAQCRKPDSCAKTQRLQSTVKWQLLTYYLRGESLQDGCNFLQVGFVQLGMEKEMVNSFLLRWTVQLWSWFLWALHISPALAILCTGVTCGFISCCSCPTASQ